MALEARGLIQQEGWVRMRVVLVEDNQNMRGLLMQLLRPLGADVVFECGTQSEAVAWLAQHPQGWDLALVDLFLARGHGIAVLRACAQRSPIQKMVLMSNYTREPLALRAIEMGADAFFDKATAMGSLVAFCVAAKQDLKRSGESDPSRSERANA